MSAAKAGSSLERKIVVLLIQSLRKIVVRLRLPLRDRRLGSAVLGRFSTRVPTSALPTHRDDLKTLDFGGVSRLSFAIFPGPILDFPFDVYPITLLQVFLRKVGETAPLAIVPENYAVPLSFLLPLPRLVVPLAAGGYRQRGDTGTIGRAPDFGICPQIPNKHDSVENPTQ